MRVVLLILCVVAPPAFATVSPCAEMEALTDDLNARGGPEIVQEVRGIYVLSNLAFGGEPTPARCHAAWAMLLDLDARLSGEVYDTPGFGVWAASFGLRGVRTGLNVRAGPGAEFESFGEIPAGAEGILILGSGCVPEIDQIAFTEGTAADRRALLDLTWCRVEGPGGLTGWVSGRFLDPR
ncbi:MAG: SH3 domain-containing protein [Shimia sp.]